MRKQVVSALVVTLVVLGISIWIDFFPRSFESLTGRNVDTRLGLDLQGGSQIFLRPRDGEATTEQLEQAAGVIERRVNGLGVSEAVVQTSENSIIVELPGISNADEATAALQGAGNLEFIDPKGQPLLEGQPVCTTATPRYPPTPTSALSNTATLSADGAITETEQLSPTTPLLTERPCPPEEQFTTIARGIDLDTTTVALTVDQRGTPAVAFSFTGEARDSIANFTGQNVGRYMAIVLDNVVISSPEIIQPLPGEGIISMNGAGTRSQQDSQARVLLNQLKYGALPVAFTVDSNRTISATLGDDSVDASLIAGLIGLGVVMLFMLLFYRLPGLLADIALVVYTLLSFAVYKLVPVTLTLPGIAGFILSIGLAVDANVLIFARIKEELQRGRSLDRAVEDGFRHAWPSIRDSNASTLITSFILYFMGNSFGVSIIQGFALTLALGVIMSLFTAITVTRMLLRLTIDLGVSNPRWFGVDEFAIDAATPPSESAQA